MASKKRALSEIAAHLNNAGLPARIIGNADALLCLSSPASADGDSLVFWFSGGTIPDNVVNIAVSEKEYAKAPIERKNVLIISGDVKLAFAYATQLFVSYGVGEAKKELTHISPSAKVSPKAKVGDFVHIGENSMIADNCIIYPFSYIGDNVSIGEGTVIKPHSVILNDTIIGKHCLIESGAVISGDGFGFVRNRDKIVKIEHLGRVVIGDFVEINANTTVDKGTLDDTIIADYTKIDNLVQVGHNNRIGRANFVASSTAIAGSVTIGNNNTIAGQVGFNDGITVGDNNMIAGRAGVTKDTGSGQILSGFPARPHKEELKRQGNLTKIDGLIEKIGALEKEIETLKQQINAKND